MVKNQITGYGVGAAKVFLYQPPIKGNRAPTTSDVNYDIGQQWIYNGVIYELSRVTAGVADWEILNGSTADVNSLTGNTGGQINPVAGNINILGDTVLTNMVGSGNSLTITPTAGGYPPSQYVIGPPLFGGTIISGYQSIQSALNTLNGKFGPFIFLLQPGWYVEDLDFSRTGGGFTQNVHLVGLTVQSEGNIEAVAIEGRHTLPDSGLIFFENINFIDGSAGPSCFISGGGTGGALSKTYFRGCNFEVSNGYLMNLPNWTGRIDFENCGLFGTDISDGILDNTGGSAPVNIRNSVIGATNTNIMKLTGTINIQNSQINCPIEFRTGSSFDCISTQFNQNITCSNNSTGTFELCKFNTGATAALTMSSSGAVQIANSIINSSNNPAISGAGAGTLTLGNVTFISNSSLAGTLTVSYVTSRLGSSIINGNLTFGTAGNKISAPAATTTTAGANSFGTVALSAGTATVNTTAVTTNSIITLTPQNLGTVTSPKTVGVTARVNGTSFTITSSDNTDTSTIGWQIIN